MPKQYTAMRDKFAKSMPMKAAKTKAAKIYNAAHPGEPVTNKEHGAAPKAKPKKKKC